MKIAFIGQKGIPMINGGVEKHVEELAVQLVRNGHKVTVYTRPNYTSRKEKEYKGVKLVSIPSIRTKNLDAISYTFFASVHCLFGNFDVIHYHSIGPSSLSFIPKLFSRKSVIIATYHCQDYLHQKWSFLARIYLKFGEFMAIKMPHKTITVSSEIEKYIKNKYDKHLVVIPNGMKVQPTNEFDKLKIWDLTPQGYFLIVSRLIRHKGVHYLINAYKKLKKEKRHQDKKLIIVGDGFYTDEYVDFLKKLVGNDKDIIFTGNQSGKVLSQIFSNAYVFIQPSESEGLSIALLEALGYGLTTLVSDIPENLEAISSVGYSFHNKNVEDLKKKMIWLIDNPEEVCETGKRAKIFANKKYNWENITQKTEKVYIEATTFNSARTLRLLRLG